MGYSLQFHRTENGEPADADREAVSKFLAARGLRQTPSVKGALVHLVDRDGARLSLDGRSSSGLYVNPLKSVKPLSGGLERPNGTAEELRFIYDLCSAAGWWVFHPLLGGEKGPQILVPNRNHTKTEMDLLLDRSQMASVFVDSPEELEAGLHGNE